MFLIHPPGHPEAQNFLPPLDEKDAFAYRHCRILTLQLMKRERSANVRGFRCIRIGSPGVGSAGRDLHEDVGGQG